MIFDYFYKCEFLILTIKIVNLYLFILTILKNISIYQSRFQLLYATIDLSGSSLQSFS